MCLCLCVRVVGGGGHVSIFYSPQAPMKRVWNPFLPQIDASHCVQGRSSLKTRLNQPWVLTEGKNVNQSIM